jgi:hypothetical protein
MAPSSLTWNWFESTGPTWSLTVISPYGRPMPSGISYYPDGTEISAIVDDSVFVGGIWHRCTGFIGTGSAPASGTTPSTLFTIRSNTTITWLWDGRLFHPFIVNNPTGRGTPNPSSGTHYYEDGTAITARTSSTDGTWLSTGWTGTGNVPPSGSDTLFNFTITTPSSVTWNWADGATGTATLTVISPYGSPVPSGTRTYPVGTVITAYIDSAFYDGGTWHISTGWLGTGSVPATGSGRSFTFTITENSTITWLWDGIRRYRLYVESAQGSPDPANGYHWYEEGAVINANVASPVDTFYCTGWEGTGSVPASGI